MIIVSDRIKKNDLEFWQEMIDIDRLHVMTPVFDSHESLTRQIIIDFAESKKDYFVAVSWGKDSVCLADMFYRIGYSPECVYIRNLTREPPENLLVRDEFLRIYPQFKDHYHEILYDYSTPDKTYFNKKGDAVKWQNILKDLKKQYGCHVTGIRYDESAKRKRRFIFMGIETDFSFAPFRYFTVKDIFAYLYKYNLPIHPNYAMLGGGRWDKYRLRVAAIGNVEGDGMGRIEWEREYYADILNTIEAKKRTYEDLKIASS